MFARRRRLGRARNTTRQPTVPIDPRILDRFQRMLTAIAEHKPIDYGVAPIGTIRFFTLGPTTHRTTHTPWYIQGILSHDRTLPEWLRLIQSWKESPLPEKYDAPLESGNPFTTRRAAAAFLTELLARELRYRWIARKFVARIRERIYARRIVGADCDLFTTEPVPAHAQICVRDRESRSLYVFHVRTATHMINSALSYSHFGIACPQAPKNPYTNRPWSVAQLMVLSSQICAYTFHCMRNIPPAAVLKFRRCGHSVSAYFARHSNELMIAGARNFLKDTQNPDVLETLGDLLDDLYDNLGFDISIGWRVVKTYVLGRLLPKEFLSRWDKVFLAVWIHSNFGRVIGFSNFHAVMSEFADLHEESYSWWVAQPKTLLRRPLDDSDDEADSV